MYRRILTPLDRSEFGECALPLATSLARQLGAELELVHVYVPSRSLYGSADDALDRPLREEARLYLEETAERVAATTGLRPEAALLEGPVSDTVCEHAERRKVDLIVMTTHGFGPLQRFWLGSVADQVVRKAAPPVLLIRPEPPSPLGDKVPLRHVLVPLDGSEPSEQVLEHALALGEPGLTGFTLLRVVPASPELEFAARSAHAPSTRDLLLEQLRAVHLRHWNLADDYLRGVGERVRKQGWKVRTEVFSGDQPAAAILQRAQEEPTDLIAMSTHGRGGLARLLLGSVADKVLRGASTPVLMLRRP